MSNARLIRWCGPRGLRVLQGDPLRDWLQATGSLTAHLQRVWGPVKVQRLRQGVGRAHVDEAQILGLRPGQRVHVREVILRCEGRAMVMARSVTDTAHLTGPWRALKGLGTRPLAELLFRDRRVHREPLSFARVSAHQRRGQVQRLQWSMANMQPCTATAFWRRRSVFVRRGAKLLVCEMFADDINARAPIANC